MQRQLTFEEAVDIYEKDFPVKLPWRAATHALKSLLLSKVISTSLDDQEEALTLGDRVVVMSEGFIQQVDTPLNVYHQPINRFVAGFVGNPSMNFLAGELIQDNGKVTFQGAGLSLVVDGDKGVAAAGWNGKEVVLGIRPDGLFYRSDDHEPGVRPAVQVKVQVVEPLGSTTDLYCATTTGDRLIARVKSEPIAEDATITLFVDQDQLHLFEPGQYGGSITRYA